MTKAALEMMIATLKDHCKQSMTGFSCDPMAASCPWPSRFVSKPMSVIFPEQMISLTALISYVAHATGRCEYRIERELSNHFSIPNPKCLSQDQYDEAISYLVEQVPASRC